MSEPEIESPTPSQVMSVSQSSEGSSIGGYVVVDECDESLPNTDSNVDGTPADIPAKSESLAQAGSMSQDELTERVHVLTKENEELKGVLLQNNTLLEEYFQELASMQKSQKETKETLRKGYDHAKEVVKKLREKNGTLKMELKNEQNKNLQLEEQLSKLKEVKLNGPSLHNGNAVEVIKRLETEKNTLELSNIKLQEHISCLKAMREAESNAETDECETLVSLESLTLTSDIQTSPAVLQENFRKLETEKEILMVDLEKIKIEMEQKQQQNSQLEEERDTLLKKLAELEQRQTLQVGEIKPEITDTQAAAAASKQIKELCEQLQVQTEALSNLKEELDAVRQESEMYKKKAEEFEKGKEPANNEDIETMKQQLQKYQEKEGADRQAAVALQAELTRKMTELKQQLETEREAIGKLREVVDNLTQERDVYKKKVEELEMHLEEKKEPTYNEDIETMKQQLQKYQDKEGADKQAAVALQAELTKKMAELKQQLETEREAIGKLRQDVDNLTQERDVYKKKVEELEMHPEEKKGSGDEAGGEVHLEDTEQKGKLFEKLKKQIWIYQKREGDILNRENAVLEKEEELKQLTDEKEKLELQLAEALKEKKTLSQEVREQDEEAQSLKRQLSNVSVELNETHEREVNQLKEELQNTNTAMTTVLSNAEQLKGNMTQLMEQNENLAAECEKLKAECAQKEEGVQSLNELNETRELEVNKLKEELSTRDEALATAEATLEPLKVQVTQLIQENQSLIIERERIMDDYTQQENMYQEHLHKITEDSEKQRIKRDEIIKTLRKQVSTAENQLQNTLVQLEADSLVHKQLREEHERVVMEYEECLQAYHTTMDANKRRESEEHMAKAGLEDHIRRLTDQIRDAEALIEDLKGHLKDGDNLLAKLKEDARLNAEEMGNVREEAYDKEKMLRTQLEMFESDFQLEREAREKQHEEILRLSEQVRLLTQENRRYADEIDQLSNRGMEEMQRRHASFVQEPRDIPPQQQQETPRGWFDGWFPRGHMDPAGVPNPRGEMGVPGQAQMSGNQREQQVPRQDEEDWQCPTCRRLFPNFDTLQIHAVECNGDHAPRPAEHVPNQCPSCMEILPDMDTLQIHIEECLERNQ